MFLRTVSIPGGATRPPDKPPGKGRKKKETTRAKKRPKEIVKIKRDKNLPD